MRKRTHPAPEPMRVRPEFGYGLNYEMPIRLESLGLLELTLAATNEAFLRRSGPDDVDQIIR